MNKHNLKVGDTVRVVNARSHFFAGKYIRECGEATVTDVSPDAVQVKPSASARIRPAIETPSLITFFDEDLDKLIKVEAIETMANKTPSDFKVGDKVKVTNLKEHHLKDIVMSYMQEGEETEITVITKHGVFVDVSKDSRRRLGLSPFDGFLFKGEELDYLKPIEEDETMTNLPVGTKLRLLEGVNEDTMMRAFKPGDIVVIQRNAYGEDDGDYYVASKTRKNAFNEELTGYLDKKEGNYEVIEDENRTVIDMVKDFEQRVSNYFIQEIDAVLTEVAEHAEKVMKRASKNPFEEAMEMLQISTLVQELKRTRAEYADSTKESAREARRALGEEAGEIVDTLIERMESPIADDGFGGNESFRRFRTEPEFHINKEKRTVVVLVRKLDTQKILERGTAKCAPEDEFDANIGCLIALHRALGLEVPKKFL